MVLDYFKLRRAGFTPTQGMVLQYLVKIGRALPNYTLTQLAKRLGMSKQRLFYHVRIFREKGVLLKGIYTKPYYTYTLNYEKLNLLC